MKKYSRSKHNVNKEIENSYSLKLLKWRTGTAFTLILRNILLYIISVGKWKIPTFGDLLLGYVC